jgi:hypothetical protein
MMNHFIKEFQVALEIGHKASTKEKVDSNGNTHTWNIFLRSGDERQILDKFVKRVVFNLHETFNNPVRTCSKLPYCVKENGYGEFEFNIDIHFHGTDKKYSLSYFLELPKLSQMSELSRIRKEMITFKNPCPEFRRSLIDGGARVKTTKLTTDDTSSSSSSSSPFPILSNNNIINSLNGTMKNSNKNKEK